MTQAPHREPITLTDPAEIELIRRHRTKKARHERIQSCFDCDAPATRLKERLKPSDWKLYYEVYQTFHYIEDADDPSPHLWHYNRDGNVYTTEEVCKQIAVKVKEDNLRGSDIITWACVACDLELLDDHGIGFTPASQHDDLYNIIMDGLEPFMQPEEA